MTQILGFCAFIVVLVFLLWLFAGAKDKNNSETLSEDTPIDSTDSRQIGILIGMTSGSITDAAAAKFALQRFEETHGRKATMRDIGTIVGLSSGLRQTET